MRINKYGGWVCALGGFAIAALGLGVLLGAIMMIAGLSGLDAAGVI